MDLWTTDDAVQQCSSSMGDDGTVGGSRIYTEIYRVGN